MPTRGTKYVSCLFCSTYRLCTFEGVNSMFFTFQILQLSSSKWTLQPMSINSSTNIRCTSYSWQKKTFLIWMYLVSSTLPSFIGITTSPFPTSTFCAVPMSVALMNVLLGSEHVSLHHYQWFINNQVVRRCIGLFFVQRAILSSCSLGFRCSFVDDEVSHSKIITFFGGNFFPTIGTKPFWFTNTRKKHHLPYIFCFFQHL